MAEQQQREIPATPELCPDEPATTSGFGHMRSTVVNIYPASGSPFDGPLGDEFAALLTDVAREVETDVTDLRAEGIGMDDISPAGHVDLICNEIDTAAAAAERGDLPACREAIRDAVAYGLVALLAIDHRMAAPTAHA